MTGWPTPMTAGRTESCRPNEGWRSPTALLTGWHEPASSHLLMLEAFIGRELLRDSYRMGLAEGYRWHEFGDVHLILP